MKIIIKSLILLLGILSQVGANSQFIFQNSVIESNGKKVNIFLGVPVNVIKNSGTKSLIEIEGFLSNKNLYSTKGKELLIATLENGYETKKTTNGKVKIIGSIANDLLTNDVNEVWEEREEFFYDMCTQCHAAQVISHHTMVEWEALFAPMKGFAKLTEEETSYLLRYIKSNASDGLNKVAH